MPINYIAPTRVSGYGKLVSTDENPNSREFFKKIVQTVNTQLNLGLSLDLFNLPLEEQPRGIRIHQYGVELHMRRTWGTHMFQGVMLLAQNLPQVRMFGHRYSNTQRIYTYNRSNRTFLFRNLIPAITELISASQQVYERRSVAEQRRLAEYETQRRQNEECQRIAREHSLEASDELSYFGDREKYRVIVYLNKYQIFKVLKSIQTVKNLVPANAGG